MTHSKKAEIMESKLVQIILLLVFLAAIIVLYILFKDFIVRNLLYFFSFF